MTKRASANVAAVIEIAAAAVRMRVSQLRRGKIEVLDRLEYPLYLGHEVFNEGRVRFETLRQLSAVLKKFTAALAWLLLNDGAATDARSRQGSRRHLRLH